MDGLTIQDMEHLQILETALRYVNSVDPASQASPDEKRPPLEAFYKDVINFENELFSKIFCKDGDPRHAFMAVAALVHLAEIFNRQRGKIHRCLQILKLGKQVLQNFRVQAYDRVPKRGQDERGNFRRAAYEFHLASQAANLSMGNKNEAIESCRWAMEYELDEKLEEKRCLPLIYKQHVGPSMAQTLTKEQLRQVDDSVIWEEMTHVLDILNRKSSIPQELVGRGDDSRDFTIRTCSGCGKKEMKLGRMKSCSKCKAAFYCSKECQVQDWATHKKQCKKAETVAPRKGPYDLLEGGVRPDGTKIILKVFRNT